MSILDNEIIENTQIENIGFPDKEKPFHIPGGKIDEYDPDERSYMERYIYVYDNPTYMKVFMEKAAIAITKASKTNKKIDYDRGGMDKWFNMCRSDVSNNKGPVKIIVYCSNYRINNTEGWMVKLAFADNNFNTKQYFEDNTGAPWWWLQISNMKRFDGLNDAKDYAYNILTEFKNHPDLAYKIITSIYYGEEFKEINCKTIDEYINLKNIDVYELIR